MCPALLATVQWPAHLLRPRYSHRVLSQRGFCLICAPLPLQTCFQLQQQHGQPQAWWVGCGKGTTLSHAGEICSSPSHPSLTNLCVCCVCARHVMCATGPLWKRYQGVITGRILQKKEAGGETTGIVLYHTYHNYREPFAPAYMVSCCPLSRAWCYWCRSLRGATGIGLCVCLPVSAPPSPPKAEAERGAWGMACLSSA